LDGELQRTTPERRDACGLIEVGYRLPINSGDQVALYKPCCGRDRTGIYVGDGKRIAAEIEERMP
jgi:hypothetical protein